MQDEISPEFMAPNQSPAASDEPPEISWELEKKISAFLAPATEPKKGI